MSHARKEARQPRRRLTGSSHCGVWGWWSKRPGDRGQCRGTTTEHRSSPWAPHQPKLACNSGTRTFCSARKRCSSNGAISTFEIRVGELHATFLRNYNMRRHKGTTKCPKQKTTQAQKTPTAATTATSTGTLHPIWGTAPVMWRCTRYVAVHPNRRGALPTDRVQCPNIQEQTRNWPTEPLTAAPPPCAAGPYWWQDGHAAHATTCTPAHSDTSHTLTCEEPVYVQYSRLAHALAGSRANNTPCPRQFCPQRRPLRRYEPIVGVCRRVCLRCGCLAAPNRDLTTPDRDLTASKRGELHQ